MSKYNRQSMWHALLLARSRFVKGPLSPWLTRTVTAKQYGHELAAFIANHVPPEDREMFFNLYGATEKFLREECNQWCLKYPKGLKG